MNREMIEQAAYEMFLNSPGPTTMKQLLVNFAIAQVNLALEEAAVLIKASLHPRTSLPRNIRALKVVE